MRSEAKMAKEKILIEMLTQNKFSNLMRCEAKLTKVEVINWIFTQDFLRMFKRWAKFYNKFLRLWKIFVFGEVCEQENFL